MEEQKKMKVENLIIDPTIQSGEGGIQAEHRVEVKKPRPLSLMIMSL